MIVRLQDLSEFYRKFFGSKGTIAQVPEIFETWLRDIKSPDIVYSLRFTTTNDHETVFWPKRIIDIIAVTLPESGTTTVKARFEILNNITDPWMRSFPSVELPNVIADFFWIENPEEPFWVTVGPYRPVFCPIPKTR